MENFSSFNQIHWLSVLVSALVAFAIGGLWYSAVLFGKAWQKLIHLSDEEIGRANMPMIFGMTFLLNVVAALFLDLFIGRDSSLAEGLLSGLVISLVWIATSFAINYLFARKSVKLFFIDAGYFVVFFTLMGGILGAW